jgi:hypothetical protein
MRPTEKITIETDWMKEFNEAQAKRKAEGKERLAKLWNDLYEEGIVSVDAEFDGSGDDGQVHSIRFYGKNKERKNDKFGQRKPATLEEYSSLREAVEYICYDLLATDNGGWEINDGSNGEFVFDVIQKKAELTFNERYTEERTTNYTY